MKHSGKDVYYIEVVGRALDVLEVFVHEQKPQLSLKEIADRLDQSMNTIFRLLYTLAAHGYVVKNNKQYEFGSKFLDLTSAKMRHTDLVAVARPYMDELVGALPRNSEPRHHHGWHGPLCRGTGKSGDDFGWSSAWGELILCTARR